MIKCNHWKEHEVPGRGYCKLYKSQVVKQMDCDHCSDRKTVKERTATMQTFLPYPIFRKSAECLDNKRLNKQITEALQIFNANDNHFRNIKTGWQNHPAVLMWRGFGNALLWYRNICIYEWHNRGFRSHHLLPLNSDIIYPEWLGNKEFHLSHQSNLVRKNPEHYRKFFPDVPNNLPYIWPVRKKI